MKKKQSPNRQKTTRPGAAVPPRSKTASSKPISSSSAVATAKQMLAESPEISSDTVRLYEHAEKMQQGINELHHSIELTHHKAEAIHDQVREDGEIVLSEVPTRAVGKPFPIVGIGASAGGYEAFVEFLGQLPKDTGMAFVLVQHLDPKHKSKLSELLCHSTRLPVFEARDNMEVQPDHVYVIPENADMTLVHGRLRLLPRKRTDTPPMPIDSFFRSLALEQQNQAIGVVLSGTGTDGTLGIEAIKGEGGICFAQDGESAKYFGMPGSAINGGAIDFVLPPGAIAKELGRIAMHPFVGQRHAPEKPEEKLLETGALEKVLTESSKELQSLFSLLRGRTNVDFSLYKHTTLKRRIIRRMVLHKLDTVPNYIKFLEKNAVEVDALFKDLLINVTSFFRDPQMFQALKKKVFPRLIKAHPQDLPLRMWVCGCATGEEAYSLAIAMMEYFDQSKTHRQVQIFATDISDDGIEKARAGIYPENISQDVSPERLRRFFIKSNGQYQVQKAVRDMCVFARQNVLVDPPFSNLDLVCCRNVLIYFGPQLQRKIIPVFHYALRSIGFLVLGGSETIGPSSDLFNLQNKKYKIYLKKPSYLRPHFEMRGRVPEHEGKEKATSQDRPGTREPAPATIQQHVDRILLRDFTPGSVVVTAQFEVVQFRGKTGDYLEHAPGAPSLNLLKMARESLVIELRAALNRAMRQDMAVRQRGAEIRQDGRSREVVIEVVPFHMGEERFFLVAFKEPEPGSLREPPLRAKETSSAKASREHRELSKLRLELAATKESMQSIIEEQEATNEELKSANEEIQSSNEELQSTNEEMETAKEELQSTNEELTTLNEELQNRNVELSQVNNDLTNLLTSVNVAILMVGEDLTIRRFTPMAERLFNLIPSDVGRPFGELNRNFVSSDLEQSVRKVIDHLTPIEKEIQDRDGHSYSMRIRPYRTRENKIDGAVIMLIELGELKRTLEPFVEAITQPVFILDNQLRLRVANDAFRKKFQLKLDQILNQNIFEIGEGQWNLPELHALIEDQLSRLKHVPNYRLKVSFPRLGTRELRLNACRFQESGQSGQFILVAIEDMTPE